MSVNTIEEYLNLSNIKEIIITDKSNLEGFFRYENSGYYILSSREKTRNGNGIYYCLEEILKENIPQQITYNWDNILKDIVEKCFCSKTLKINNLEYCELYLTDKNKSYIYNFITNSRIENNVDKLCIGESDIYVDFSVDITFFSKILKRFIPCKNDRDVFKLLCRSIFIKPIQDKSIIFYDYYYKSPFLWNWLNLLSINGLNQNYMKEKYNITINGHQDYIFEKASNFSMRRENIEKMDYRICLYDKDYHNSDIRDKVNFKWAKVGICNYYVKIWISPSIADKQKIIYDISSSINYVKKNEHLLKIHFPDIDIINVLGNGENSIETNIDFLLSDKNHLFSHMFKWIFFS